MQKNQAPALVPVPFADSGQKNVIPTASSATPGAASYVDGFPAITLTSARNGGIPPNGKDFNGILNAITSAIRWGNAGGQYSYSAAFANDAKVGGYPAGAVLMRADGTGHWINTVDDNKTNPDATDGSAAGWVPGYNYGVTVLSGQTGGTVPLTPAQAAKDIIIVKGALTSALTIVFPTFVKSWTILNQTTGAFSVQAKTATGTAITITRNVAHQIYCDGTTLAVLQANNAQLGGAAQSWQDVTSSRASGTTYTNATGRPIMVSVYAWTVVSSGSAPKMQAFINGMQIAENALPYGMGFFNSTLCFVVPINGTYQVVLQSGISLNKWSELS